jgi:hypothetical protein
MPAAGLKIAVALPLAVAVAMTAYHQYYYVRFRSTRATPIATNWDGRVVFQRKDVLFPSSVDDVVAAVAGTGGTPLKVVGAGHSWSDIAAPEATGLQVSLDRLNRVLSVDVAAKRVRPARPLPLLERPAVAFIVAATSLSRCVPLVLLSLTCGAGDCGSRHSPVGLARDAGGARSGVP